jgi:hypothetical protein
MAAGAPLAWSAMADAIGSSFNQRQRRRQTAMAAALGDGSPSRESAMDADTASVHPRKLVAGGRREIPF